MSGRAAGKAAAGGAKAAASAAGGGGGGGKGKTIIGRARLFLSAGQAAPGPAIGQALGPLGVNMMEFCKQFNSRSQHFLPGVKVPVKFTAYSDRSFDFLVTTPTTMDFLKRATGIEKGSGTTGQQNPLAFVEMKTVYEIAKIKKSDPNLQATPLESICKSIIGTARSMGLEVKYESDDRSEVIVPMVPLLAPKRRSKPKKTSS